MDKLTSVSFRSSHLTSRNLLALEKYESLNKVDTSKTLKLNWYEFRKVSLLGEGRFSSVFLVLSQKRKMALKCLDPKKIYSSQEFLTASIDLFMEAKILSSLDHENIIKLRGVCSTSLSDSFYQEDGKGYFILTDVMQETLKDRIRRWRIDPVCFEKRRRYKLFNKKGGLDLRSMYGRIATTAMGIAKGMKYLHERDIILRDLKPQNIGFHEATGKVCLFDFGFARPLSECSSNEICGTPRYMSPEVMQAQGYSLKSDVYSFGIVLYEICSLKDAFNSRAPVLHDSDDILNKSEEFASRPPLHHIPCDYTRALIEDCWSQDPNVRPSFDDICSALTKILRIGHMVEKEIGKESSSSSASIITYKTEMTEMYSFSVN